MLLVAMIFASIAIATLFRANRFGNANSFAPERSLSPSELIVGIDSVGSNTFHFSTQTKDEKVDSASHSRWLLFDSNSKTERNVDHHNDDHKSDGSTIGSVTGFTKGVDAEKDTPLDIGNVPRSLTGKYDTDFQDFLDTLKSRKDLSNDEKLRQCIDAVLPTECDAPGGEVSKSKAGNKSNKGIKGGKSKGKGGKPWPNNPVGKVSTKGGGKSHQSPSNDDVDGNVSPYNKGKSGSGKSSKGRGNSSKSSQGKGESGSKAGKGSGSKSSDGKGNSDSEEGKGNGSDSSGKSGSKDGKMGKSKSSQDKGMSGSNSGKVNNSEASIERDSISNDEYSSKSKGNTYYGKGGGKGGNSGSNSGGKGRSKGKLGKKGKPYGRLLRNRELNSNDENLKTCFDLFLNCTNDGSSNVGGNDICRQNEINDLIKVCDSTTSIFVKKVSSIVNLI